MAGRLSGRSAFFKGKIVMNIIDIALGDIVTGRSYRVAMVNIEALAANITEIGLLQPIGITPDRRLIFGGRRLAAFRLLKRETIPARVIAMDRIVLGTYAENEMRENFTVSERVAIYKDVLNPHGGGRSVRSDNVQAPNSALDREQAAIHAGLGGHTTAYEAEKIVEAGVRELVDAVDRNEISIHAGYLISKEEPEQQKVIVQQPKKKRAEIVNDLRSTAREKTNGKKSGKKSGGGKRPPKQEVILPTYTPSLTFEEQGFPPRETWDEPDPDRPGLTRYQGFIAKHGHVHIMPLHVRQAQDARIATRKLSSQIRELKKQPVTAFLAGEPIDLTLFTATLDSMGEDADRLIVRLSDLLAEIMPAFNEAHAYLTLLVEAIKERKAAKKAGGGEAA
jgi:ParB-like chromosome segregation protein Spo0J